MSKINSHKIDGDVASVILDAESAVIAIEPTAEKEICVKYTEGAKVHVAHNRDVLVIKQTRRKFERLFRRAMPRITIQLPEHIVPSVTVTGNNADAAVYGGIFSRLEYYASRGKLSIERALAESVEIKGDEVNVCLSGATVKGSIICAVSDGGVALDDLFATHADCRVKRGDIGAVNLNCRDSAFEADEGNITASVLGDENAYEVIVTAKNGTCNKESKNLEREDGVFKAFSAKGNIFVDFIRPEKEITL